MTAPLRWMFGILTGVLFLIIGAFIAFRPLWSHNATLLSARWLDLTMAAVCLLRGMINIRTAIARRRNMPA